MNHADHVNLIRNAIPHMGGVWADLGSGGGAFTLALADMIGETGEIYSVDRDSSALKEQRQAFQRQFPKNTVHYLPADFSQPLTLPVLDGILLANSLHFIRDKASVLALIHGYLKPAGRLIIVEYNADQGNQWVPYPFAYPTWEKLAAQNGFTATQRLATYPSLFLREIYSAVSLKPAIHP